MRIIFAPTNSSQRSNFSTTNNIANICEPIKNNRNHDNVQLINQINTANNNDFNNDVEMENGHNVTNGKYFQPNLPKEK